MDAREFSLNERKKIYQIKKYEKWRNKNQEGPYNHKEIDPRIRRSRVGG
jgi:hypothetical protein